MAHKVIKSPPATFDGKLAGSCGESTRIFTRPCKTVASYLSELARWWSETRRL